MRQPTLARPLQFGSELMHSSPESERLSSVLERDNRRAAAGALIINITT
jgi:hypothetical protein